MAKPRIFHNRAETSEGPGDMADKAKRGGRGERERGGRSEGLRSRRNNPLPPRAASRRLDGHPSRKVEETAAEDQMAEENEENEERRRRDVETPRGALVEFNPVEGGATTCASFVAGSLWRLPASQQRVAPSRGNSRQRCMAVSLVPACCPVSELVRHALWRNRAPLHGNIGGRMAGALSRKWNSERLLIFAHIVLSKTLGIRRAREIRDRITRRMDLWERGQYVGLVGDAKGDGAAQEGRAASVGEEEENAVARSFHKAVLSVKLWQAVHQATNR